MTPHHSKTIGILGGMSSESTQEYYRRLDRAINDRFGGHTDAELLIRSLDFGPVKSRQERGDWDAVAEIVVDGAQSLEDGGAEFVLLASNTIHRIAAEIEAALSVPFVHIVDPTATAIREAGLDSVGLLGTRHVLEGDFYIEQLRERGIDCHVPGPSDRQELDEVIFAELTQGEQSKTSRRTVQKIAATLVQAGADGIVLGCTELDLLVEKPTVAGVPVFDTTALHVERAVALAVDDYM